MPPRLKSRMKYCPTVSDEMTKFFDFEQGTTPERYEAAIRARVEGSDYVYWRNQFDTSDAFGDLIRQRRAYKELSEAADENDEDDMLATIRPDDARQVVGNKLASAQRKDKHVHQEMRVERTFQSRTMRLTRMDATGAPAANATATQAVPQTIARLDGAEAEPGPSILKKRTKVNFNVDNDVEDDGSVDAPRTTPKRRLDGVGAVNQAGVRLLPGTSSDDLRAQLAESKAANEELKHQMELQQARHASEQRAAQENVNCIVEQVQEQSRKQQKELAEQSSAKDNQISGLNAKLKQQSDRLQAYYEQKNALETDKASLNAEVAELRRQKEDQSQKLASMAQDAKEAQETLQQMSDQLFARNDALKEKVSSLEPKCASLESDLSEVQAEKDALKEKAEKFELEIASLEKKCASLESNLEDSKAEKNTLKEKVEKLVIEVDLLKERLDDKDKELVAERTQLTAATAKEKAVAEKTLAKQREDATKKNADAASTAAGSQASTQQQSTASRASVRSKQNASQGTSQSTSASQFNAPAANPIEPPATAPKRSAMQPIPLAQSMPVGNRPHAAVSSPREPKRTKDSVKASVAASLRTNVEVPKETSRACTSMYAATSDNKENAEHSPTATVPNTVPWERAAAPKKPSEAASKAAPKSRMRR
ncbi:hypothetical protein AAVH_17929 [Aphelenchoides avenae]|nr:hypothetical protein AAVH_17929 [Aphelenchus avenae]